ncbi:MAG: hypothetical protein WCX15_02865 [Bacilli bacterium]|jgi:hypothetical protein|nr:hypothetical protein [Mollicutes bacterium]
MKGYVFEYLNENDFRKLEKSVKKYNMIAYKKLVFDYYPSIKEGKMLGKLIETNSKNQTKTYELKLPTNEMFAKVHGDMKLNYTVYEDKHIVLFNTITPTDILTEGHRSELSTFDGVILSKQNAERDMFKINLLKLLEK